MLSVGENTGPPDVKTLNLPHRRSVLALVVGHSWQRQIILCIPSYTLATAANQRPQRHYYIGHCLT